jgi:tetratricopeptide (TPR) repeat protein
VRGEYLTAHEIATQLLQVAQREQDPGLLVEAHALMGVVAFYLGEFITAQAQLEQSMALYDPRQHRAHAMQYGQDPWVACRSYLAWTLWTLGYPDQAQERSREAIAYAQELQHPMSLAFALGLAGILQNAGRDPQAGHDRAEELIALASEHGLPYWVAQGIICRGRALLQSGRATAGLAQIQQAMQARREKDGLGSRPSFAIVAEAYEATGETEAGFQALAEAQAAVKSSGERYSEAELYRLKGELLLTVVSL